MELALDHLTVTDTTPSQLVRVAAETGARAVCLFLQPMTVLPRMPPFELIGDTVERRETRALLEGLGIGLDLVYPFTLAGRTDVSSFDAALETAAWLGAQAVNVLAYDREPERRADTFAAFCERALALRLGVVVEFYPASQVRTLEEAAALAAVVGDPDRVGVNVDLLHLLRSGDDLQAVAHAPAGLRYAQLCDGPCIPPPDGADFEASSQRLYPGEGTFDVKGFVAALPPGVRISVEAPREDLLCAGLPVAERARRALRAALQSLG